MRDFELARLCAESYLPGSTIQIGDDLAANVVGSDVEVVVAFRGTANAHGWLRDLNALPKSHELLGYVHHGFLDGACALMQKLDLPTDRKVILTGHSLGGALAVVLGALRIAGGDRVDSLVTFGAPKAGFSRLEECWRGVNNVRQYHNGNDPVPDVPLTLRVFPYQHIVSNLAQIGVPDREPWRCHAIQLYISILESARL